MRHRGSGDEAHMSPLGRVTVPANATRDHAREKKKLIYYYYLRDNKNI